MLVSPHQLEENKYLQYPKAFVTKKFLKLTISQKTNIVLHMHDLQLTN